MFPKRWFYFCTVPALLVLWGILIYQPSFHGPFQFDDNLVIVENPPVKTLGNLSWLWMFDPSRFLTHLSFALNYRFNGFETFGYHLVNFLLHIAVSLCVYFFAKFILFNRLLTQCSGEDKERYSLAAVCLFLFHPLQTQAVSYIAQRATLLAALFYLLTVIFYVRWREGQGRGFYILALLTAVAGIFTKPNFITLPFALLLCEVFFFDFLKPGTKKALVPLSLFFLIAAVIPVLLILWKYKTFDPNLFLSVTKETDNISRGAYLLTQFNVLARYIFLVFIPIGQNLDYDFPLAKNFWDMPTPLSFLVLAGLFIFAVKMFKKNGLFSFCIFWCFLTLSLESSLFPIADVIFEHRMYLPMAGAVCLLPVLFRKVLRGRFYFLGTCFILIAFSVLTYRRNILWGDQMAFLQDMAAKSPRKARVHNNLGIAYEQQAEVGKAEQEYKTAIALKPQYAHPHNNLGNIYAARGEANEALEHFEAAIVIDPKYPAPLYNKGNLYFQKQDYQEAWEYYKKALQLNPYFVPALVGMGSVCLKTGDLIRAKFYLSEAIRYNPESYFAYYTLGDLYRLQGDYQRAALAYREAFYRNNKLVSALNNIGNIRNIQGKYLSAARVYEAAIAIDPAYSNAYFNLGNALAKMGQKHRAINAFKKALALYENENDAAMVTNVKEKLQQLEK